MKYILLCSLSVLLLAGCERFSNRNSFSSSGWVPVYSTPSELSDIGMKPAKATLNSGKIYTYGNYIFQNEQYEGFHIIDNSNPSNPVKTGFFKIPYSTEISIRNNHLYTNSVSDLLVFNISNMANPVLVKKIPNAFPLIDQLYPPVTDGYFECPDLTKGIIVKWDFKNNITAKCRR
jgi:hypothetical protein